MSGKKDLPTGVNLAHPDLTPETAADFFTNHEASKAYRESFISDSFDDLALFAIIKSFLLSSINMTEESDLKKGRYSNDKNANSLLHCFEKMHILDKNLYDLLDLTIILSIYGAERNQDVEKLQKSLENKYLPKTPISQQKQKSPAYLRAAAAYFATLLHEYGASKKQAVSLSANIFGFSESFLKQIIPDIEEVKLNPNLDAILPFSDLSYGFAMALLSDHSSKLENIISDMQEGKTRSNKLKPFNETIKCFKHLLITKAEIALNKERDEQLEKITNDILNDFDSSLNCIHPNSGDSIVDLIHKNASLYIGRIAIYFPSTLEEK